jgi:hypothetical protein
MKDDILDEIARRLAASKSSPNFPQHDLEFVRTKLEQSLAIPITLVLAGEYEYSDALMALLNVSGTPIDGSAVLSGTKGYRLNARVSHLAPYAALDWQYGIGRSWQPLMPDLLSSPLSALHEICQKTLSSLGYVLLSEDVLSKYVSGQISEMDDAPATVRQLLFTELA